MNIFTQNDSNVFSFYFNNDILLNENIHIYVPKTNKILISLYTTPNDSHPDKMGGRIKLNFDKRFTDKTSHAYINLSRFLNNEKYDKSWLEGRDKTKAKKDHNKMIKIMMDRCSQDFLNHYKGNISEKELIKIMQNKIPEYEIN